MNKSNVIILGIIMSLAIILDVVVIIAFGKGLLTETLLVLCMIWNVILGLNYPDFIEEIENGRKNN